MRAAESHRDTEQVAATLRLSIGLLLRRLRLLKAEGELTLPESSALTHLERGGPASASELARLEQISPQSMGATLAALQARGLLERRADSTDGRRVVLSVTEAGLQLLRDRHNAAIERMASALAAGFTREEIQSLEAVAPLLERLAQSI